MRKNLLFSFFMLLAGLIAGGGSASAQQTPADGGVYYIYNVESGQFLSRGTNYGTHVCTAPVGILWQVVAEGATTFKLKCYDIVCEGFAAGAIGTNCYADNGNADEHALFTFTGTSNGYTLVTSDGNLAAPTTAGSCEFSTAASTWQFLDKDEFAAKMSAIKSTQESTVATTAGITLGSQTLAQVVENKSNWVSFKTSDGVPTKASWNVTTERGNDGSNEGSYGCELFNNSGSYSKTITGLKKGVYKVTFKGLKRITYPGPCFKIGKTDGYTNSDSYFIANGNLVQIVDWASSATQVSGDTYNPDNTGEAKSIWEAATGYNTDVFCYVGDDGKLEMKATSGAFWYGGWFLFGGVDYTYYADQITAEQIADIIASVPTGKMLATIQTALDNAKTAFETSQTIANYNALSSAIDDAKASVEKYAKAKKFLAELNNTNVYTSAKATELATMNSQYEAGTLSHATIDAIKIGAINAWHAADSHRDFLLSAWTIGGEQCIDFEKSLYINTWSNEAATDGTGMYVPFYEYFVEPGSVLAPNTLAATITGLSAGQSYGVTALVRVHVTNEKTAAENGITMQVGEGTAVDVCKGTAATTGGNYYYGTYTAYGKADASGNLVVKFNVAENSNISWLSFKNVVYGQVDEATMAIGSAKWATFIAPFDVNIPAGVTANKVTGTDTDGKLVYEEITTGVIPANTPVVVNSETAVNETFYKKGTATEPSYTAGLLTGVYAETSAPVASYVLQDQISNGLGFYKVVSGKQPKVAANHAYMTLPSGSMSARSFYSVDGGGTTVIDGIQASETGAEKEVIYDLSGRRVSNAGKGIYIVNGRKIVK